MLNVQIVVTRQSYGYIELAWNHALHGEHPLHAGSTYYLFRVNNEQPKLIAQIDPLATNYKYFLSPQERGETIRLGLALYDIKTKTTGEISLLQPIATIPNPPSLIIVKQAHDNLVKLEWLAPNYKTEIRGYLVERSTDGMRFDELAIASVPHYTDIGGNYKAPTNGNRYYYRISAVTYAGTLSSPIFVTVNVQQKQLAPVPTLIRATATDLPLGSYRIKAVGANGYGETPWVKMHNLSIEANEERLPDLTDIPLLRIRALTPEGDTSLIVKTHNVTIPANSIATQTPMRIRTIGTDGTESWALPITYIDRPGECYMVNNFMDFLTDLNGNKMTNSTCNPIVPESYIINKKDNPVVNKNQTKLIKRS